MKNIECEKLTQGISTLMEGVETHRKIAAHLQAAAKCHLEAAKYYEVGEEEKAEFSSIIAQGYLILAGESQMDDVKHHA